jgi:hypothetical protein
MRMDIQVLAPESPLLREPPVSGNQGTVQLGLGRTLATLALTGLLFGYLMTWMEDLKRVHRLEAEPTPPSKVITKQEAWQRIYQRSSR